MLPCPRHRRLSRLRRHADPQGQGLILEHHPTFLLPDIRIDWICLQLAVLCNHQLPLLLPELGFAYGRVRNRQRIPIHGRDMVCALHHHLPRPDFATVHFDRQSHRKVNLNHGTEL